MMGSGDYIDWYCSGIRNDVDEMIKESWSDEERQRYNTQYQHYVGEGCVTAEIRADLERIGWIVRPGGDWENFE